MSQIKIGDKAPIFTLKDQNGNEFNLSNYKTKKILLSFHPLAWTSVCAKQMQALEEHFEDFQKLNAIAVGISVDSAPCKKAWAESLVIEKNLLLADFWPHGQVAKLYNIFREKEEFSERANITIDQEQRIAWLKVYPIRELPNIDEVLDMLSKI